MRKPPIHDSYHGINLSLGSIRNHTSCGIGEYLDIIPLIKWVQSIGFHIIQLLPLNDSGTDPSPYSALSAKALHPIYISLSQLPNVDTVPDAHIILQQMQQCNSSRHYDYHRILAAKELFLRKYFLANFSEIQAQESFQTFIAKNKNWLTPFALFMILREQHNKAAWWEWKTTYRTPTSALLYNLTQQYSDEINFYQMVQYLAFSQMHHVQKIAHQHGVLIKGDIPILINKDSADVWMYQQGFICDLAAGAPPDMYSGDGQYWGFPLYNWAQHEQDHQHWWKERLHVAEQLYDIYRIDHIVGFYRIWAVPLNQKARFGAYLPQDPNMWIPQGENILRTMLQASSMLPIGEDLGIVPDEVRASMKKLHIPGTKVMRWERFWHKDKSFIPIEEYLKDSMTTVSTHDSETLVEWWQKAGEDAVTFAQNFHLRFESPIPFHTLVEILKLSHASNSLYHINLLQEYLALFPELSWEEPATDRINIPGKILSTNWTYRFKPFLDDITSHQGLKQTIRSIINLT